VLSSLHIFPPLKRVDFDNGLVWICGSFQASGPFFSVAKYNEFKIQKQLIGARLLKLFEDTFG